MRCRTTDVDLRELMEQHYEDSGYSLGRCVSLKTRYTGSSSAPQGQSTEAAIGLQRGSVLRKQDWLYQVSPQVGIELLVEKHGSTAESAFSHLQGPDTHMGAEAPFPIQGHVSPKLEDLTLHALLSSSGRSSAQAWSSSSLTVWYMLGQHVGWLEGHGDLGLRVLRPRPRWRPRGSYLSQNCLTATCGLRLQRILKGFS